MSRESSNLPSNSSPAATPSQPAHSLSNPSRRRAHRETAAAVCPLCELTAVAAASVLPALLPTAASERRARRVERMESLCLRISSRVEGGQSVSAACRLVARQAGRRRLAGASFQNLHRLFTRWVASGRQRAALSDRYSVNRKVSASLAAYFAAVATRPGTRNLSDAFRIVRAAWKRGAVLPGLGSFLRYPRSRVISRKARASLPPLPVTYSALLGYFTRSDLQAFCEQRAKVERARRLSREALRRAQHQLSIIRARLVTRAAQRGEGTNS